MDLDKLKNILNENYHMDIREVIKKKNIYIVKEEDKEYCLKTIKYEYPHFKFILAAIKHLQNKGFKTIPPIIKTSSGSDYIKLEEKFCYLSPWIPSRESNYDNIFELLQVSRKLGELHKCSEGFTLDNTMKPRIYWFKWIDNFNVRKQEIFDFKKRISQKAYKSEFDELFLKVMNEQLMLMDESICDLKESNYFERMNREVIRRGFCHHDYAHHNVLRTYEDDLCVIDFDYVILDTCLHDLSSLIIRSMKNGKWDIYKGDMIINNYNSINPLEKEDSKIIASFVKFPQQYWQLGIQYYWEQQHWGEEFFLNKLKRYIEDCEERRAFAEDLKQLRIGGDGK